jgi:hypothetical protein
MLHQVQNLLHTERKKSVCPSCFRLTFLKVLFCVSGGHKKELSINQGFLKVGEGIEKKTFIG